VARALIDRGFTLVRPLAGGLDAWVSAGYQVEPDIVAIRPAEQLPVINPL
jgi:rhodanese-related sulfurtransferase